MSTQARRCCGASISMAGRCARMLAQPLAAPRHRTRAPRRTAPDRASARPAARDRAAASCRCCAMRKRRSSRSRRARDRAAARASDRAPRVAVEQLRDQAVLGLAVRARADRGRAGVLAASMTTIGRHDSRRERAGTSGELERSRVGRLRRRRRHARRAQDSHRPSSPASHVSSSHARCARDGSSRSRVKNSTSALDLALAERNLEHAVVGQLGELRVVAHGHRLAGVEARG